LDFQTLAYFSFFAIFSVVLLINKIMANNSAKKN